MIHAALVLRKPKVHRELGQISKLCLVRFSCAWFLAPPKRLLSLFPSSLLSSTPALIHACAYPGLLLCRRSSPPRETWWWKQTALWSGPEEEVVLLPVSLPSRVPKYVI